MQPSIRSFNDDDAPSLWQVFHDAVQHIASADYTPEQVAAWAPEQHDPSEWLAKMRSVRPFVAEVDGAMAGFADVQPTGYIDMFFVSPRFNRMGVGAALMRHLLSEALAMGITELHSNVSITARPFFVRFGFVVVTPQQVTVRGVEFVNYRMQRLL